MNGILLVDKPSGMTSHDVVGRVRKAANQKRVGHTGTLDPSATGLLILCLGASTRLSEFLTGLDKTYEGVMRLGVETDSYDLDGEVVEENEVPDLTEDAIKKVFIDFVGQILQVPPMVSAVKVGGERLYKKARKGETVERDPRAVNVYELSLLAFDSPDIRFRLRCSRGTYARSIAHDAGRKLGCGAALAELRRTAVGRHTVEHAVSLDALDSPEAVHDALLPPQDALDLPEVRVRKESESIVGTGGMIGARHLRGTCPVDVGWVQVKGESGELLALAEAHGHGAAVQIQPRRVFVQTT